MFNFSSQKLSLIARFLLGTSLACSVLQGTQLETTPLAPGYSFQPLKETKGGKKAHQVTTYHVSCQSDKPTSLYGEEGLAGMVLYLYDGKQEWVLNKVHCKTGYILLKKSKGMGNRHASHRQLQEQLYRAVFNQEVDHKVVASGFVYLTNDQSKQERYTREWKFDTLSFNAEDSDPSDKKMELLEQKWVMKALANWITTGKQNTTVTDELFLTTTDKSTPYF